MNAITVPPQGSQGGQATVTLRHRGWTLKRVLRGGWFRIQEYVGTPVLGVVPRLVFGNNAGLMNNVLPRLELYRLQRRCEPLSLLVDARVASLRDEGYARLDPGYDPRLLAEICGKFRRLIEEPASSRCWGAKANAAASRLLLDPLARIPELKGLITEELKRLLVSFYRCHFQIGNVRCWRNYHVPEVDTNADVYSNQWHNDPFPVTSLRLFVYLSDVVTRETGAFRFHPASSTKEIVRSLGYLRRSHIYGKARSRIEDPSRIVFFEGGAGSACLCNVQRCMHRAGVPCPGATRDIAQFYISPADRPLPEDWECHVPPDPVAVQGM